MENNYQEKEWLDVKKIFLFITIIPYIIFLLLGIYNCINSSFENKYLDLYALIEPLDHFWFEVITDFNIFFICLTVFCVGYPIYYLLDKSNKKKLKKTDNNIQAKVSKSFILYIISFIPYLFLIYSCIFGIDFGFFGNTSTYYGFEALFITVIAGCIVPVYPIILIFQIIYTIKKYKTFTLNIKRVIKYIIISIILLILIPSFINLVKENNNLNTTFNSDKIVIEDYLMEEFGEHHYKNMEVVKNSNLSNRYTIKTPLLEYGFSIELNENRTDIVNNSFYETFVEENSINDKLDNYLNNLYELPNDMKIKSNIQKFDIKNYIQNEKIENLLYTCEYNIARIEIFKNSFDKENVTQKIKDFYIKNDKTLEKDYPLYGLDFYVKVDGRYYAAIDTSKQNDTLTLRFSGYNYGDGYTINNDRISIDLSAQ